MVINDNITYEGALQSSGHWGRIESYGPKLVENIVQATARDCLAEAITRVEAAGYPVIFHVHDELICEVPEAETEKALKDILEIMGTDIPWAPGLSLNGDGYSCEYYRKD
jgi:DNA polymerase